MPSPSELDSLLDHPWILRTYAPVYVMRFPAEPDDATLDAFCAAGRPPNGDELAVGGRRP